jgi:hypothetical protein
VYESDALEEQRRIDNEFSSAEAVVSLSKEVKQLRGKMQLIIDLHFPHETHADSRDYIRGFEDATREVRLLLYDELD